MTAELGWQQTLGIVVRQQRSGKPDQHGGRKREREVVSAIGIRL
jgi:hypothetical protein